MQLNIKAKVNLIGTQKFNMYDESGVIIQGKCPDHVEMEYCEMLFWLETKRSDKELYWIIAQSRPVQMISY